MVFITVISKNDDFQNSLFNRMCACLISQKVHRQEKFILRSIYLAKSW